MKKIQLFFALLFISFIIVMFTRQSARKKKLYKESLHGKVISFEKKLKGYYHLTIIENNKLRYIGIIPESDKLMVSVGDSIYKENNSDIFYIKKSETPVFIKTDWKDTHISGKWEE